MLLLTYLLLSAPTRQNNLEEVDDVLPAGCIARLCCLGLEGLSQLLFGTWPPSSTVQQQGSAEELSQLLFRNRPPGSTVQQQGSVEELSQLLWKPGFRGQPWSPGVPGRFHAPNQEGKAYTLLLLRCCFCYTPMSLLRTGHATQIKQSNNTVLNEEQARQARAMYIIYTPLAPLIRTKS